MARYCSDCTNLKVSDEKSPGVYKCPKRPKDDKKQYVPANTPECEHFSPAYARSSSEREKLYDLAKKSAKDKKPDETLNKYPYILLLIGLIALIYNFFS